MKLNTNPEWFKELFKRHDMTLRSVAKKLKMPPSSLSKSISGQRKFLTEEVAALAELLGAPVSDVMENIGVRVQAAAKSRSMRLVGAFDGEFKLREDVLREPKVISSVVTGGANLRVARCQIGEGRYAHLDGSLVYFRESDKFNARHIGKPCVVRVKGDPVVKLRVPRRSYNAGRFDLYGIWGELLEENKQIEATSPVVEIVFST